MYSLLVSGVESMWAKSPAEFPSKRIFEHTVEPLARRFKNLNGALLDLPALFAYESALGAHARVGRVERIQRRADGVVRIGFAFTTDIPPIHPEKLVEMAWDLDIVNMEFTRTHWAVKEVDLLAELARTGVVEQTDAPVFDESAEGAASDQRLSAAPVVFKVPATGIENDLVSVMRPFKDGFECVSGAVEAACAKLELRCRDANTEWHESEIVQDVFSLLYRSRVVVCDFSDQNPNVFYETGIAHTLGRPVIPIVRDWRDVPFDLCHHRYLEYKTDEGGLAKLEEQIEGRLRSLLEIAQ